MLLSFDFAYADSCESAVRKVTEEGSSACVDAHKKIEDISIRIDGVAASLGGYRGVDAAKRIRSQYDAFLRELQEGELKDKAKQCTKDVDACLSACPADKAAECKSVPGKESDRIKVEDQLKSQRDGALNNEKDSSSGGAGEGEGKEEKGKEEGSGGGEMPQMQMPQKEQKKPDDPSCTGQTPGPGCPPKDDCFGEKANSLECKCRGTGAKPPECSGRNFKKTKLYEGEESGGSSGNSQSSSFGSSAPTLDDPLSSAPRRGGSASLAVAGGGGGGGGGSSRLSSPGAGSASSLKDKNYVPPRTKTVVGGGGSGGSSSGGGGGSSGDRTKGLSHDEGGLSKYEQLAAQGAMLAHRRINGVSQTGEIAGRHTNLFENLSRAYRNYGSKLLK